MLLVICINHAAIYNITTCVRIENEAAKPDLSVTICLQWLNLQM